MRSESLLLVANSEQNADMLFAVGIFLPDPCIFFRHRGTGYVVLNDLEVDRGRRLAKQCRVLALAPFLRRLTQSGEKNPNLAAVVQLLAQQRRIRKFWVPPDFPHGLARELRRRKVRVKIKPGPFFFPERELKRADEVKKISAALMMAEVGMAEAMQAVRNSKIGPGERLIYRGTPLTSERLRAIIQVAVIQAGGTAGHTIVAGGRQGCDPHEEGHGPLRANRPIIIDIFPRSQKTGYHGDITRTVVRGRATEAVRRLFHTVHAGQDLAFGLLRQGTRTRDVHQAVLGFFEEQGFPTRRRNGRMEGFFHGTGHGLGLEVHEPPSLTTSSEATLQAGHVVTVEPGLYYPAIGGVRLEDVALVTTNGASNLTKFEKVLEL